MRKVETQTRMNIQRLSVDQLNPAPYNPRIAIKPGDAAWRKLERSLAEFDLVQPIVWNERTGHVVSGHQRLTILKHRGETEVDCVVVDLPPAREQALNITLNNSSVGSEWDPDKLVEVLTDLQSLTDFDATLTGFDPQQLADLVLTPAAAEGVESSSEDVESDSVTVTLEIPRERWEEAETELNAFLREFPETRMHVGR